MRNTRNITYKKALSTTLLVFFIIGPVAPMFLSMNSNNADEIVDLDVINNDLSISETSYIDSKYK